MAMREAQDAGSAFFQLGNDIPAEQLDDPDPARGHGYP